MASGMEMLENVQKVSQLLWTGEPKQQSFDEFYILFWKIRFEVLLCPPPWFIFILGNIFVNRDVVIVSYSA